MKLTSRIISVCAFVAAYKSNQVAISHSVSEDDSVEDPHVHVQLSLRALALLQSLPDAEIVLDGEPESKVNISTVATYVAGEQDALVGGQVLADFGGGSANILGNTVGRSVFSHFYNPETKEGYRGGSTLPEYVAVFQKLGLVSSSLTQLLGPAAVPSTSMSQWAYATALHALVGGSSEVSDGEGSVGYGRANLTEAIIWASHACHLIQDASVPQHTTDRGAEDSRSRHVEYEQWVEEKMEDMPTSPITEILDGESLTASKLAELASLHPVEMVKQIAVKSSAKIDIAMGTDDTALLAMTAPLLDEAVVLSAALLIRLFAQARNIRATLGLSMDNLDAAIALPGTTSAKRNDAVQAVAQVTEDDMVVFQITKVVTGNVELSGSDLRPLVQVIPPPAEPSASFPQESLPKLRGGYLADSNVVYPQRLINAYGWTFAHKVSPAERAAGRVVFEFSVSDVHANLWCAGGCGDPTIHLDIGPNGAKSARAVFNLDRVESLMRNVTTGCDKLTGKLELATRGDHKECGKSATVSYSLGRSYAIYAVTDTFTTSDLVFGSTPAAFALFVLSLCGIVCCLGCCCCTTIRARKKTSSA